MNKMHAVRKTKNEKGFELQEIDIPEPGENEVLVKVKVSTICGSDIHLYNWDEWSRKRVKLPRTVGHEMSGEVVELGSNVSVLKSGDTVSVETHIICGKCYACKTNHQEVCQNLKILGFDIDGSYAEYVRVPAENCFKNDKNLSPEIASLLEPLGNAYDTVLSENISGKTVLITGCGPLGLMGIALAKTGGAGTVIATEINPYRIKKAEELNADYVINPQKDNVVETCLELTGGNGVDILCEMSGNPSALREGLMCVTPGGRVSLLGLFEKDVSLSLNDDVIMKRLRIYGITGRKIFSTWFRTSRLLESGVLDIRPILTHKFSLKEFEKAFSLKQNGNCGKIALIP